VGVNTARRIITGSITGRTISTTQCFVNIDIPPAGPTNNRDAGVVASLNAYTGQGSGSITLYDPNTNCVTNPVPTLTGPLSVAPQGPRYGIRESGPADPLPGAADPSVDTDRDGCRDDQELKDTGSPNSQGVGGMRDPFNRWDLMDQFIAGAKDRAISGGDIGVVVGAFGTTGSPTGDPLVPPTGPGYHVSKDRNASIPPANGGNSWNLLPPNGSISGGDIGAVVGQFGHTCTST
jgi:hypothetical protein